MVTRTRCIPSKSWQTQRQVGTAVGGLMWCGTVVGRCAKGWRRRRCATEETRQAHVLTRRSPWSRPGVLTTSAEANNRGSLSQRQPPSTRD
jgi:hypothetical protein